MAKTAKQQLKTWFQNLKKPTQEQFWHWLDSYWHKDEKIPQNAIEDWDEFLKSLPNDGELKNYLLRDGANINAENREVLRAKLGVRDLPPNLGLVDAEEEGNVYTKAQVDELNQTLQTSLNEIDLTPYYTAQQVDDNFATKDDTHTEFQQMQNAIDKIHLILQTEDVNLDTLQEISDRIKTIAENNDNIQISDIQGLTSIIESINSKLDSNDSNLSTIQQIVDYVKIINNVEITTVTNPENANQIAFVINGTQRGWITIPSSTLKYELDNDIKQ